MERNLRKTQVGIVTSNKMDKTIVVAVEDKVKQVYADELEKVVAKDYWPYPTYSDLLYY